MQGLSPGTSPPPGSTPILVMRMPPTRGAEGDGHPCPGSRPGPAATCKDSGSAWLTRPRASQALVGDNGPAGGDVPGRGLPLVRGGAGVDAGVLGRGHRRLVLAEKAELGQLGPHDPGQQTGA